MTITEVGYVEVEPHCNNMGTTIERTEGSEGSNVKADGLMAQRKQYQMAQKEAKDINRILERSPTAFEDLLTEIEHYAKVFDWNDQTMNWIFFNKVHVKFLNEIDFDLNNTWEHTKKQICKRFTYSSEQIERLLELFTAELERESRTRRLHDPFTRPEPIASV